MPFYGMQEIDASADYSHPLLEFWCNGGLGDFHKTQEQEFVLLERLPVSNCFA